MSGLLLSSDDVQYNVDGGEAYEPDAYCFSLAYALSLLGAAGVGLQNYQAVLEALIKLLPASKHTMTAAQLAALGAGGMCSGAVNFFMNVKLIKRFLKRVEEGNFHLDKLKTFEDYLIYYGGIFVFIVTGILFGLMAFAFASTGPLAVLSVMAGVFVAAIMTIQEVETFLDSYEVPEEEEAARTTAELVGKWCGHLIAAGNVVGLSLLFTLSLAQSLMMVSVAAFPAVVIGALVAFSFGAFTEYYFYNAYLSKFCKNFAQNWQEMMETPNAALGLFCASTNGFVNAALAYSALLLLTELLITAGVALPSAPVIMAITVASSFFVGSASFILGIDFWIDAMKEEPKPESRPSTSMSLASVGKRLYGMFPCITSQSNDDAPAAENDTGYTGWCPGFSWT